LRYVAERCTSTVFGVTNSSWAISRFVRPAAARSATRRSLGVSAPGPAPSSVVRLTPLAASSVRTASASAGAAQARAILESVQVAPAG